MICRIYAGVYLGHYISILCANHPVCLGRVTSSPISIVGRGRQKRKKNVMDRFVTSTRANPSGASSSKRISPNELQWNLNCCREWPACISWCYWLRLIRLIRLVRLRLVSITHCLNPAWLKWTSLNLSYHCEWPLCISWCFLPRTIRLIRLRLVSITHFLYPA